MSGTVVETTHAQFPAGDSILLVKIEYQRLDKPGSGKPWFWLEFLGNAARTLTAALGDHILGYVLHVDGCLDVHRYNIDGGAERRLTVIVVQHWSLKEGRPC